MNSFHWKDTLIALHRFVKIGAGAQKAIRTSSWEWVRSGVDLSAAFHDDGRTGAVPRRFRHAFVSLYGVDVGWVEDRGEDR
jgi:hypothetical protein